jgi:growth hormone-inducible transmembrane protein
MTSSLNIALSLSSSIAINALTTPTMAFILRRPFAITNALKQAPRATRATVFQPFQQTARQYSSRQSRPLVKFAKNENVFLNAFRQAPKRRYQSAAPQNPIAQGNLTQRLIYGGTYLSILSRAVRSVN